MAGTACLHPTLNTPVPSLTLNLHNQVRIKSHCISKFVFMGSEFVITTRHSNLCFEGEFDLIICIYNVYLYIFDFFDELQ